MLFNTHFSDPDPFMVENHAKTKLFLFFVDGSVMWIHERMAYYMTDPAWVTWLCEPLSYHGITPLFRALGWSSRYRGFPSMGGGSQPPAGWFTGWWLYTHPVLKKIRVRQLGWWKQPNINGKIKFMATKPPTSLVRGTSHRSMDKNSCRKTSMYVVIPSGDGASDIELSLFPKRCVFFFFRHLYHQQKRAKIRVGCILSSWTFFSIPPGGKIAIPHCLGKERCNPAGSSNLYKWLMLCI